MAEPIPIDDEISKTQLWERINVLRAVFESHKGEIMSQIESLRETLRLDVNQANSVHDLSIQKKIADMLSNVRDYNIDMAKKMESTAIQIKDMFQVQTVQMDQKFRDTQQYVHDAVKTETLDIFTTDQKNILEMQNSMKVFQDGMNKSLSNFQVEYRGKIGELNTIVQRVISKLKDWFQDL